MFKQFVVMISTQIHGATLTNILSFIKLRASKKKKLKQNKT